MRKSTVKNIITASAAIVKMSADERETVLLMVLEKNPSAVITAMANNGVTFGDKVKTHETYNVVVQYAPSDRKIHLIKFFREMTGAGLAEAKDWTESKSFNDLPSGVLFKGLTKKEADNKLMEINKNPSASGIKFGMILGDAYYPGLDMAWRH